MWWMTLVAFVAGGAVGLVIGLACRPHSGHRLQIDPATLRRLQAGAVVPGALSSPAPPLRRSVYRSKDA
jgi:hypothetical protein